MPVSYTFYKNEIKEYIHKHLDPMSKILDVGPGIGTYSTLLQDYNYNIDCVEIFEPYIEEYDLKSKYNNVFIDDILNFNISKYDFIILGDVLEHIETKKAQQLIKKIVDNKIHCLVAVPYKLPQRELNGNIFEAHQQEDLTPNIMLSRYPQLKLIHNNSLYGYYITKGFDEKRKSYILHANEKYYDIVKMCVKSIRKYSNYPIYVYLINSDKTIDIDGVETINWKLYDRESSNKYVYTSNNNFFINRSNFEIYNLLIQKILITKHALQNFSNIVAYIDADSIATPYIDNIFNFYNIGKYPYFTTGIYQYMMVNGAGAPINGDFTKTLEHPACELFNISQKNRNSKFYRQSGYFVASIENVEFLDEWHWMSQHPKILKDIKHFCPFNEETTLNILLWKNEYNDGLPLIYVNGSLELIDEIYLKRKFTGKVEPIRMWLKIPAIKEELLFFHGEKRIDVMEKMIERIHQLHMNELKEI